MLACDIWTYFDCITWQLIFMWGQGVSCHITCCVVEVVCLFFQMPCVWHGNFEHSTVAACEYMATHFLCDARVWVAVLHAVQWKLCALFWSALCLTWQLEHRRCVLYIFFCLCTCMQIQIKMIYFLIQILHVYFYFHSTCIWFFLHIFKQIFKNMCLEKC